MVVVLHGDNTVSMTSWAAGGQGDTEAKHISLVLVTGRAQDGYYPRGSPGPVVDTYLQETLRDNECRS